MTTKFFLISHNEFALGVKKSLEMITGAHENVVAYGMMPGDHPNGIMDKIKAAITPEDQVFILGDIAGGSVCNAALELTVLPNITLITGMNLPLVIEMVLTPPQTAAELASILTRSQEGLKRLQLQITPDNEEDFF